MMAPFFPQIAGGYRVSYFSMAGFLIAEIGCRCRFVSQACLPSWFRKLLGSMECSSAFMPLWAIALLCALLCAVALLLDPVGPKSGHLGVLPLQLARFSKVRSEGSTPPMGCGGGDCFQKIQQGTSQNNTGKGSCGPKEPFLETRKQPNVGFAECKQELEGQAGFLQRAQLSSDSGNLSRLHRLVPTQCSTPA